MIIELLIKHEGLRLKPYKDSVGKLTIGVGRNLSDNGITREEALLMLRHDIDQSIDDLKRYTWFDALPELQKVVMIDMMFNLGATRFKGFKKMIKAMSESDWEEAAVQMMDSKWSKQVGDRAVELSNMMRAT